VHTDHYQQWRGIDIALVDRAVRDRPVELTAVWRGDISNPALLRLLRDVLPQREWTTSDVFQDVLA
jgi:hypothetical protein